MSVEPHKRMFTVDDYYAMAEAGILRPGDRAELIEGEVVDMSPVGPHHESHVMRLLNVLARALEGAAMVCVQRPIRLGDLSEPEPDVTLVKPRADFYSERHPASGDILLVVEVSESSLRYDRETKLTLYGQYGVREYWILDVASKQIEVYREPGPGGYGRREVVDRAGTLTIEALPELELAATDFLG
jgi:Uma2 family endonuclease